jgi:hypothetical protein
MTFSVPFEGDVSESQDETQLIAGVAASSAADVLRVTHRLGPQDRKTLKAMLLHLGYREDSFFGPRENVAQFSLHDSAKAASDRVGEKSGTTPQKLNGASTSTRTSSAVPSELEREGQRAPLPPDWLRDTVSFTVPIDFRPAYRERILPLLEPRHQRALILRMGSKSEPIGEIDFARLVIEVARQKAIDRAPRKQIASVRAGLYLLIDISPSMQPFFLDAQGLVENVQATVGREAVEVGYFHHCPLRGLFNPETGGRLPWRSRPPGQSVIVVTDFGAGRFADMLLQQARPSEWAAFTERLRRRSNVLTVLTPYPKHRLPAEIVLRLRVVSWNRDVGIRSIEQ